MREQFHLVPFEGARKFPGEAVGTLQLVQETRLVADGIAPVWDVYPVTIVMARYKGTYEGGRWLAFPIHPYELEEPFWSSWNTSDPECMAWWDNADLRQYPIGRGEEPDAA